MTIEELHQVVSEGGRPQIAAEYGAHIALRDARINALQEALNTAEARIAELEGLLVAAQQPAPPAEPPPVFPPLPEKVALPDVPQGLDGAPSIK